MLDVADTEADPGPAIASGTARLRARPTHRRPCIGGRNADRLAMQPCRYPPTGLLSIPARHGRDSQHLACLRGRGHFSIELMRDAHRARHCLSVGFELLAPFQIQVVL